jgi:hypothetical protein
MNHLRPRSKILLLIMIILASCVALVAARETRAIWQTNPEGSVHIDVEDDVSPVNTHLLGPSGVDGFALTKATAFPVDTRLPGPSGVDGFAQIKATVFPVNTRLPGPSGVDELKEIKVNGDLMP